MHWISFSYNCTCTSGFSGPNCEENIDDCLPNRCLSFQQCVDGVNSYQCICPVGKTGQTCNVDIDYCSGQACLNGATCKSFQGEILIVS